MKVITRKVGAVAASAGQGDGEQGGGDKPAGQAGHEELRGRGESMTLAQQNHRLRRPTVTAVAQSREVRQFAHADAVAAKRLAGRCIARWGHRPGQLPQHVGAKAQPLRILGAPQHAHVARQTAQVDLVHVAFAQPAGQPGARPRAGRTVVFLEGAVGVDARIGALADHHVDAGPVHRGMQCGAGSALHAMVRPQRLRLIVELDQLERRAPRMRAGERNVAGRVPVLRGHHVPEPAGVEQLSHAGNQRVAVVAGQRAAGHEVRLQVDHDQGGMAQVEGGHGGVRLRNRRR